MKVTNSKELKLQIEFLKMQKLRLLQRYERQKRRDAFVKKNLKRIKALRMDGWPRTMQMKDRLKWIDLVYEAKIAGVYSPGTANCDVIANLNRHAMEQDKSKKS